MLTQLLMLLEGDLFSLASGLLGHGVGTDMDLVEDGLAPSGDLAAQALSRRVRLDAQTALLHDAIGPPELVHVLAQKPRNRASDAWFTTVFEGACRSCLPTCGMAKTPLALMQQSRPHHRSHQDHVV